jgi:hypothetical protein
MSHAEQEDNLISVGDSEDIDDDKVRLYGATGVSTRLLVTPVHRTRISPDTASSVLSLPVSVNSEQVRIRSDILYLLSLL